MASSSIDPSTSAPAVVRNGNSVSLADHLNLHNLPLAATPGGKNFVLKALHPAESSIRTSRCPGGNRPSATLFCDMVEVVPIVQAGTHVTIYSIPSPSVPCTVALGANDGTTEVGTAAFGNGAFGSTYVQNPTSAFFDACNTRFQACCEAYRVVSQSVTVELIAPALSNQGTVLCAQLYEQPQKFYAGTLQALGPIQVPLQVAAPAVLYDNPPRISSMILGTNAYSSPAAEGVYAPLKMSKMSYKPTNRPEICLGTIPNGSGGPADPPLETLAFNSHTVQNFPYCGMTNENVVPIFPKWSSPHYTKISVEGTAANVALRIRVRQGVEIIPYPGTVFASLVETPLPPDDIAIRMFYEISSKMKDGYPASYNDLGSLKGVIMKLGHELLPYVNPMIDALSSVASLIPGASAVVPIVSGVAKEFMGKVGQHLEVKRQKKKEKKRAKQNTPPPLPPRNK